MSSEINCDPTRANIPVVIVSSLKDINLLPFNTAETVRFQPTFGSK